MSVGHGSLNPRAVAYPLFTYFVDFKKLIQIKLQFCTWPVMAGTQMHLLSLMKAVWPASMSKLVCVTISHTDQDFPAFGYRGDTWTSRNRSPVRTETCFLSCKDFLIESHLFWCHLYYTRIITKAISCISYISFFYFPCLIEPGSPQSDKGGWFCNFYFLWQSPPRSTFALNSVFWPPCVSPWQYTMGSGGERMTFFRVKKVILSSLCLVTDMTSLCRHSLPLKTS